MVTGELSERVARRLSSHRDKPDKPDGNGGGVSEPGVFGSRDDFVLQFK